jgi:hypothetical protein
MATFTTKRIRNVEVMKKSIAEKLKFKELNKLENEYIKAEFIPADQISRENLTHE